MQPSTLSIPSSTLNLPDKIIHNLIVHDNSGTTKQSTKRNRSRSMRSSLSRSRSSKSSDLLSTLRHTRGEGNADVAGGAGAGEGRGLGLGGGVCRSGGVLGVKNTIES